ncbi:MAG TPA: hypothetical protein VGB92_10640 [Longimicrobium sp.]|jgi:hypothetical protein
MQHRVVSSCAVLVLLAACSDHPAGSTRSLREATTISGTVSASFTLEGAPTRPIGTTTDYRATVDRGVARQDPATVPGRVSLGRVVSVSDASSGEAPSTRTKQFLNAEAQMVEVSFHYLGRRNIGITYRVNGERTASVVKRWRRGDGGWLLEGAEITSYEGERVRARLNLDAENIQVAQRATFSAVASHLAAILLPTTAYAQDCSDEERSVVLYGGLSVVACGSGAVLACAGALIAFYNALDALEECAA